MTPRSRRVLLEGPALAVVVVASLLWLHDQQPHQDLPDPPVGHLPPPADCDPADQADEPPRLDSTVAVECPDRFDGRTVTYTGEIVGDVLRRDGGAWVQINDDTYALQTGPLAVAGTAAGTSSGLAVWLPDPLDEGLAAGRANRRGHVVTVTGTFHLTDPADGGGTTIRTDQLTVLRPSQQFDTDVPALTALLATALLAAAGIAWHPLRRR